MLATKMRMSTGAIFYPYKINQSCRFNNDDNAYLIWTPSTTQDDTLKSTVSFWFKYCNFVATKYLFSGYTSSTSNTSLYFNASNQLIFHQENGGSVDELISNMVFRDVGSWYHLCIQNDHVQVTASDRVTLWINNVQVTWTGSDFPGTGDELFWMENGSDTTVGTTSEGLTTYNIDAYMTEIHAIDGQALTPSSFGQEKNGVWIPKKYTGTYGTNGFYLDFADENDLGKDISGNDNDFTSSGLESNDQNLDSPTNNWCNWNGLTFQKSGVAGLSDGNLKFACATDDYAGVLGTFMLPKTGKWYWEIAQTASNCRTTYGIATEDAFSAGVYDPTGGPEGWGARLDTGGTSFYRNDGGSLGNIGFTFTNGEVLQVAYDADTGKMWFGSDDDDWDGDPEAGTGNTITISDLTLEYFPFVCDWSNADNASMFANFGQLGFTHTPPIGFKALNSKNMSNPTVKDSSVGFGVITYEGNTDSPRTVTGLNFQPDMVWIKNRDGSVHHNLYDSVRGVDKAIIPNEANIESDQNSDGYLSAFNSDGFEVTDGSGTDERVNQNTYDYAAWCFRMGSRYGFDIQTYEGTGVAKAVNHNLGGVPEMWHIKNIDGVENWRSYHYHALNKTDPETDFAFLNLSNAWNDSSVYWNDTKPTSTQFTVGTDNSVNENGDTHIAYLWRSIPQFSKVFSFEGNGNADGTFVWCGFRPRYVIYKDADGAYNWWLIDTERGTYNPVQKCLQPDNLSAEQDISNYQWDILSNGFKLRSSDVNINENNHTIVGIAYAEQPGKWSNAR